MRYHPRSVILVLLSAAAAMLLLGACAPAAPAPAQPGAEQPAAKPPEPFPTKPIELVVPFGAGGGFDAVARQLASPLQRELGQPVVVKNMEGAGQRIAGRYLQQQPADGHTIGYFADNNLFISTLVEPGEGFDMTKWVWVAAVRGAPAAVFVPKNSPFKAVQDIIAADKAGQRIRMGHGGLGNFLPQHVIFATSLGLQNAVMVGGFGGFAALAPSLIRGDLDVHVHSPISTIMKFVESGDLRPLVQLQPQRNSLLADIPTARELGLPNVSDLEGIGNSVFGISVPPGTPPERVKVLEQAVAKALKDPGFLDWARKNAVEPDLLTMSGKDFAELKQKEYPVYKKFEAAFRKAVQ